MWKTTILKLSSYLLSWRQYRFCKIDFSPPQILIYFCFLCLRTSHLSGNLVFCKVCASQLVRVVLALCSGAIRRESSPLVYQLNFFLYAHFIQVFSWQPLHLFCCLASQLPPCFIENAFFYFLCWFFNDL